MTDDVARLSRIGDSGWWLDATGEGLVLREVVGKGRNRRTGGVDRSQR